MKKIIEYDQAKTERLAELNKEMFGKSTTKSPRHKLKEKKAKKLASLTVEKAAKRQSPNRKRAVHYSVKFIFCLRSEANPNMSYKAIWRQMKAKGFKVGKGNNLYKWADKGSQHWFRLMGEKGDGAKYFDLSIQINFIFFPTVTELIPTGIQRQKKNA